MDWIGKTLGKVYIESLLARGGMAEVYLGTHTSLQRKVAVKILRNYHTDDILRPLERFELEARAVARLRHPNIVQVFDFDSVEDQPYLVMEYIPGPSLSKYLSAFHAKGGRLGLPLINQLVNKIAGALQYAHDSGVIHRDVKPGNILLSSRSIKIIPGETLPLDLEPVLTDFGLVRFLNSSRQTMSGLITGTPAYMSPEQAMGEAADGRTDIYSLGIVLYELLSGRVPFDGESTMSILLKHLNEPPPPIPGLSPPLQQVLDRALAKSAADRFESPAEFAAAFSTALQNTSQANTLVTIPQVLATAKAKPTLSRKQRSWMPAILAGVLIALVGGSLLFNGMLSSANREASATPTILVSDTPLVGIPVTMGVGSVLHFQDGSALLDQAALIAQAMPAPPVDHQYKVWLLGGEERLLLGILRVDGSGKGQLTFSDPQNKNLLATYSAAEITIEQIPGPDPDGGINTAYAYALPEAGLAYMRRLLVSDPGTAEQIGLIQGLASNAELINEAARKMLDDHQNGNQAGVKQNAESIMNLLVGNENRQVHKDWDGNGRVTDPGDGYGFLLNGDNLGYIQAVYSHADYAINSSGATRNMIVNGENVKVCTQNLARWVPELREHMFTILSASTLTETDSIVRRSADLADQMLNGIDLDENGEIDPVADECGILSAYDYAYHMADMPLLPVTVNSLGTSISPSETVMPALTSTPSSFIFPSPTRPRNENQSPTTGAPANEPTTESPAVIEPPVIDPPVVEPPVEQPPAPGKEPKPTKEPKDPPPGQDPGAGTGSNTGSGQEPKPTKDKP
jgi:serine/threonine protein kinase